MKLTNLDYKALESILTRIASSNNIENVESIDITMDSDTGIISFKQASHAEGKKLFDEYFAERNKKPPTLESVTKDTESIPSFLRGKPAGNPELISDEPDELLNPRDYIEKDVEKEEGGDTEGDFFVLKDEYFERPGKPGFHAKKP